MKVFLLFIFLFQYSTYALSQELPFTSGNFICVEGNNDSICPQKIKAVYYNGRLVEFKVMYNGDCAGQGPYSFYCSEDLCEGLSQRFQILDNNHYHWQNSQHDVLNECLFEREIN